MSVHATGPSPTASANTIRLTRRHARTSSKANIAINSLDKLYARWSLNAPGFASCRSSQGTLPPCEMLETFTTRLRLRFLSVGSRRAVSRNGAATLIANVISRPSTLSRRLRSKTPALLMSVSGASGTPSFSILHCVCSVWYVCACEQSHDYIAHTT